MPSSNENEGAASKSQHLKWWSNRHVLNNLCSKEKCCILPTFRVDFFFALLKKVFLDDYQAPESASHPEQTIWLPFGKKKTNIFVTAKQADSNLKNLIGWNQKVEVFINSFTYTTNFVWSGQTLSLTTPLEKEDFAKIFVKMKANYLFWDRYLPNKT